MAAPKAKNSSVIVVRARETTALPAATLGYASLVTPDTYDPDKPMFKANFHYAPGARESLADCVRIRCSEALAEKLQEEAEENKLGAMKPVQNIGDWLEAQIKQPKEGFAVQFPFIRVTCKATRKGRDGEIIQKEIGCWDKHGAPLDLKAMKLGIGSVVEPIVVPALFFSKLIGFPQPKLYLAGLKVLKLVSYGGVRPPEETDDESIREALADPTFEADDLSAFAAGRGGGGPQQADGPGDEDPTGLPPQGVF